MISEQLAGPEHVFLVCNTYAINKNKGISLGVYLQACFCVF